MSALKNESAEVSRVSDNKPKDEPKQSRQHKTRIRFGFCVTHWKKADELIINTQHKVNHNLHISFKDKTDKPKSTKLHAKENKL